MASRSLGTLFVDLLMKTAGFETDAGRAARVAKQRSKEISASMIAIGTAAGHFLTEAAEGIAHMVEASIASAAQLAKLSEKTGLSTEALSGLRLIARETGLDMDALGKMVTKVAGIQFDAATGSKKAAAEMKFFGITAKDTADTALDKLLKGFGQLPPSFDRAGLAVKIFGQRLGTDFLLVADRAKSGVQELEDHARSLGVLLSQQTAKNAEEFESKLADIKVMAEGLALQLASQLLPDLIELTNSFRDLTSNTDAAANAGRGIVVVIEAIGSVMSFTSKLAQQMGVDIGTAMDVAAGGVEMQKNIMSLGMAGGTVAEGRQRVQAALDARRTSMADIWGGGQSKQPTIGETQAGWGVGQDSKEVELTAVQTKALKDLHDELAKGAGAHAKHAKAVKDDTAALQSAANAATSFHDKLAEIQGRNQSPFEQAAASANKEVDSLKKLAVEANKMSAKTGILVTTQDLAKAQEAVAEQTERTGRAIKAQNLGLVAEEAAKYAEDLRILKLNEVDLKFTATEAAKAELILANAHELGAKAAREQEDPGAKIVKDLQDQLALLDLNNAAQATFNQLKDLGAADQLKYHDAVLQANQALIDQEKAIAAQDQMRSNFTTFFSDIISGSKSASSAFKDLATSILNDISRMIAQQWVDKLFGQQGQNGGGSFNLGSLFSMFNGGSGAVAGQLAAQSAADAIPIPGYAAGGFVTGGQPMIVGEKGPEFFMPSRSGTIVPNHKLGGNVITVNFANSGPPASKQTQQQLADVVASAVRKAQRDR